MTFAHINILIIDDSRIILKIVQNHLRKMGFSAITAASNGLAGLKILQSQPIDLIISDWAMPVMTGFQLLQTIRRDENLRNLPFIMLTAEGQQHLIDAAHDFQVDRYILKPFDFKTLQENITAVLPAG